MTTSSGLLFRIVIGTVIIVSKTRTLLHGIEQNDNSDIWWPAFVLALITPITAHAIYLLIRRRRTAR